ncbi:ABC transporter permease [Kutzneria sp. CA-103260]|uniref:ABC transporter permease n=1 Tax=Kutzneria sp. CA-103260 TaxID=2802641 RepID=UPI001BADCA91|nr:ABC transporter permease [Kutzneria sp. CA-103260]QUQ71003.1 glycine/betaine ABC transporter permease [Kutzneria sp. CA-103260]
MTWVFDHLGLLGDLTVTHVYLSVLPVVIGLIIAIPLGWAASRWRPARAVLLTVSGLLYTIPSLALIVILPALISTKTLDPINVIITLSVYTVALLVRSIADALSAVPPTIVAAATAIGYRPVRRFVGVEFPLAIPVVVAGLRVAMVSNISLVSVGALIGIAGYGQLFTEGFQRQIVTEIVAGIIATLVLALVADVLLQLIGRLVTPWTRVGR